MRESDLAAVTRAFAPVVKQFVSEAVAPLQRRIAELEARPDPTGFDKAYVNSSGVLMVRLTDGSEQEAGEVRGPKGDKGEKGESVKGDPGRDGRDGEVDLTRLTTLIENEVRTSVNKIPPAEKGDTGDKGDPGKDADMDALQEFLADEVRKAVAAIPAPKDGKDGLNGKDGIGLAGGLIDRNGHLILTLSDGTSSDRGRVVGRNGKEGQRGEKGEPGKDANVDAIRDLIKEVASQQKNFDPEALAKLLPEPERGEKGDPGRDGKDADPVLIERTISEKLAEIVSKFPAPKDGKDGLNGKDGADGRDGKNADITEIKSVVVEEVQKAVAGLPPPKKGERGDPGADGRDGRDGLDADMPAILVAVTSEISKAVSALPSAQKGEKGDPGKDGLNGKDGVSFEDAIIDSDGALVLTKTDGKSLKLGRVKGERGDRGENGKDGLGFDDVRAESDGERTISLIFERGDTRKSSSFEFPVIIDRGVYTEGSSYARGDAVTWGGSLWIAQEPTSEKPESSKAWRLAVKRGRDGRDVRPVKEKTQTQIR